jgi:hypothetical protein
MMNSELHVKKKAFVSSTLLLVISLSPACTLTETVTPSLTSTVTVTDTRFATPTQLPLPVTVKVVTALPAPGATISASPTSVTVSSVQGLTLTLTIDNATYSPGQAVTVTADERNTLPVENVVAAAVPEGIWRGLGIPAKARGPIRIELYQDIYNPWEPQPDAAGLYLYDPHGVYFGPIPDAVSSFRFEPSSDTTIAVVEGFAGSTRQTTLIRAAHPVRLERTITQHWQDGEAKSFTTGVYTVVARDEWGAVAALTFKVS